MSNSYYTLQVDRCELGDDPDTWRFLVNQCVADETSVVERFFDSQERAVQYGSTWAAAQHDPAIDAAAIEQFRRKFHSYGFDVSAYNDEQIRHALREEALATTDSRVDLFVRAFQRLRRVEPNHV